MVARFVRRPGRWSVGGREVYRKREAGGKSEKHDAAGPRPEARPRSHDAPLTTAQRRLAGASGFCGGAGGRGGASGAGGAAASGSPRPTGRGCAGGASAGGAAVAAGFATGRSAMGPAGFASRVDVAVGAQAHRGAAACRAWPATRWPRPGSPLRLRGREARRPRRCSSPRLRLGVEVEAAALGHVEPHLAVRRRRRDRGGERRARGDEPRAAALDLDLDRAREAVERRRRLPTRAAWRPSRGRAPRRRRGRRSPATAPVHALEAHAVVRRLREEAAGHVLGGRPRRAAPWRARRRPRARGGSRANEVSTSARPVTSLARTSAWPPRTTRSPPTPSAVEAAVLDGRRRGRRSVAPRRRRARRRASTRPSTSDDLDAAVARDELEARRRPRSRARRRAGPRA